MKLRTLSSIALFAIPFLLMAPVQAQAQEGKTLRWDLQDERFEGLSVEVPGDFTQSGSKGMDFDFTLKLTNNRPEQIAIKRWELKLEAKAMGKLNAVGGEVQAKAITLAPGQSHELTGHFTMGAGAGKNFTVTLSEAGAKKKVVAIESLHGDALVGIIMTVGSSSKEEAGSFLVKYHYDESTGVITPYFTPAR